MADFLDEKRKEIQARLKELKPAVEEYNKLLAADQALGGLSNGSTAAVATVAAAPARRGRRSASRPSTGAKRGRPKGGGTAPPRRCGLSPSARASPSRNSRRRWGFSRTTSTA